MIGKVETQSFKRRRHLLEELEPVGKDLGLRLLGDGTEEVFVVGEHFELEACSLTDDLADLVEGLLVLAGHLDDHVLVARTDGGFAKAELIDTPQDDLAGLGHGALANRRLGARL